MAKITVVQEEENQVPVEVMAKAIVDISNALIRINLSGLKRKALVILLSHSTGQTQKAVAAVLDGLDNLKRDYLNK